MLTEWTERLRLEAGERFPEKVTAFRPDMAVHGRFGRPCPRLRRLPFSGLCTRKTNVTTVPVVKQAAGSWRTEPCPAC